MKHNTLLPEETVFRLLEFQRDYTRTKSRRLSKVDRPQELQPLSYQKRGAHPVLMTREYNRG